MTVGIVGIGLIGGSFARVYHEKGHKVLAFDIDKSALDFAKLEGTVDGALTDENISGCDLVLICVVPQAAVDFIEKHGQFIGSRPVVIDCCGNKRYVCERCFPLAEKFGFTFVGGHPMAGTQYSGYANSKATLFNRQPMVIVPPEGDDIDLLEKVKRLLEPAGFGRYSYTSAEAHDEMIAFTSQMAHVVSNAYIKSPAAEGHKGFSAGSYRDLTRVAWLDPKMWAELFIGNKDYLLPELDNFIRNVEAVREAVAAEDEEGLVRLLEEGRQMKAKVDGR